MPWSVRDSWVNVMLGRECFLVCSVAVAEVDTFWIRFVFEGWISFPFLSKDGSGRM